jgi:acyl-CoA thioesterase
MTELELAERCGETLRKDDKASHALGIETEVTGVGAANARMTIRDDMVNGLNACHGGLIFTLADTAFAFACNTYNNQSFAASAQIEFLRPAKPGDELLAIAGEDYRGRRSAYYTVRVQNQREETVALFRGRSVASGNAILDD